MKSVIIGTAGHIDHGKTALVKALTGIDADRLAEEKRRGITIDLGFAHMDLPTPSGEPLHLAFVDVPGHERFIRNMLAGVGGIDLVLLVIAADESIKPQTREHLDILRMLGVHRMIPVITKADAVDAETLNVVRLEVEEFLRASLPGPSDEQTRIPTFAVSALTGAGLNELKAAIVEQAERVDARDATAITRLPIDRVFTMKGFGTVVTGTLIKGTIRVEDELEVLPGGRRVRVRGLQVHGKSANEVRAGQRTAVNLSGASTEDLARGMTLVPPATLETTRRADVHLQLLPSAPRPLKNRARVHFHCQTTETVAEVILQQRVKSTCLGLTRAQNTENAAGPLQAAPGEEWMARLRFAESPLLLPMDHFIIRQLSPTVTIGGGRVIEIAVLPRQQEKIAQPELLKAAGGISAWSMGSRVARRGPNGIALPKLIAETGETAVRIESQLSPLISTKAIVRAGTLFVYAPALNAASSAAIGTVSDFHKKNPLVPGMSKEALRAKLKLNAEAFTVLLESAARDKKLEIAGDLVKLPQAGVVLKDEEAESKTKIEKAFAISGLKVPALNEVLAGLRIDKARATKLVTLLLRDKVLVKISDELVFHHTALAELRRLMAGQKAKSPKIDVARFKELTGVSRKYAIPLLEYLDRERVTKRIGDAREIL
jgi:selenocysteine-specific elongation factor